jgi:tripeptide aminopeptidase
MGPDIEAVIADTLTLAAVPAPTGAEGRRADAVAERLAAAGLAVERDAVGNVVARAGPAGAPATIFSAHLDTVFAADVPLAPRREGGRLLGPGVGDDTVAVAALVALAGELAAEPPAGPVVLAATVGEEGLGDLRGAKHLLATVPARAFLAVEGHMLDELVVGGIGSVRLRARYRGPGGHSWGDRGTPSALHAALAAGAAAVAAVPEGRHVNVGVARGGTTVNAIAERAELLVDLRDEDAAALATTAERVAGALARAPAGVEAAVERVGDRAAGRTPAAHPLLAAIRAVRAELGLPAATEELSSTECNAAFAAGVPTAGVGITRGGDAHRPTEWIEAAPIADGLALLRRLARALPALRR